MRYMVCGNDGRLVEKIAEGDDLHRIISREVGEPGFERAMAPAYGIGAFVNDCGHYLPEQCPRNEIGSCLLVNLGARPQPFAGPIVFTGWAATDPLSDQTEICSLSGPSVVMLRRIHADLRALLDGVGQLSPGVRADWRSAMHDLAHYVRMAPTPTITILTGDEIRSQGWPR